MSQIKLVSYPELKSRYGISFSRNHIRRLEKAGKFPMHVDVGDARIGWLEHEVTDHLAERVARRRAADPVELFAETA
jgi:prophage regulatory protein